MGERRSRYVPLARRVLVVQVVVVVLAVGVATVTAIAVADRLISHGARDRVTSVAATLAASDQVVDALRRQHPPEVLGPLAERVMDDAELSFVVFTDPVGIRHSHPDPEQVGEPYIGDLAEARATGTGTEVTAGTLGDSVRTVVRIDDPEDGRLLGFVAVGVTLDRLRDVLVGTLPLLLGSAVTAAGVGVVTAVLFRRWVRSRTGGLSGDDIEREHVHLQAVLAAVREGLVVVDAQERVVLANTAAHRLLGLPDDAVGRKATEVVDPEVGALLAAREPVSDATALAGERVVVLNSRRVATATDDPERRETVTTIRDLTQIQDLADELGSVNRLLAALRAQTHEADNRLQTMVTLIELGETDEAIALATADATRAQALTDELVTRVGDPTLVALLLGKTSEAHERGVDLRIEVGHGGDVRELQVPGEDLVTIVGNLLDNAIEAVVEASPTRPRVTLHSHRADDVLELCVTDNGTGLGGRSFSDIAVTGYSTRSSTAPDDGRAPRVRGMGSAIVERVVRRLGGTIDVRDRDDGIQGAQARVRLPLARTGLPEPIDPSTADDTLEVRP
jgi:two-component system, CitB family, sensor kinase